MNTNSSAMPKDCTAPLSQLSPGISRRIGPVTDVMHKKIPKHFNIAAKFPTPR